MHNKNFYSFQVSFALILYPLLPTCLSAAEEHGVIGNDRADGNPPAVIGTQKYGNVVGVEVIEEHSSGTGSWTPERMRNAKPLDILREGEPLLQDKAAEKRATPGPAVIIPGEEGEGQPESDVGSAPATDNLSRDSKDTLEPMSYAYDSSEVSDDYTRYPYRTIGKLFGSSDQGDFVCSAAAVVSNNRRLVITAGHCVAQGDGSTWYRDLVFIPAYKDGERPYGVWRACGVYTSAKWFNDKYRNDDMGAIKICDKDGALLHNVVGALGFVANVDRHQNWDAFGYPAAEPFNGERLFGCQASYAMDDPGSLNTIGIGCDMKQGSSGGPWILKFGYSSSNANYLNGLNSYGYPTIPDVMFSPYFGNNAVEIRRFAMDKGA